MTAGARALARRAGIGQRWGRADDRTVVVVDQVHRGDRTVEGHREGDDPRTPGARFQLSFGELAKHYRPLDETSATEAV